MRVRSDHGWHPVNAEANQDPATGGKIRLRAVAAGTTPPILWRGWRGQITIVREGRLWVTGEAGADRGSDRQERRTHHAKCGGEQEIRAAERASRCGKRLGRETR